MSAGDQLGRQFFHGSDHLFEPGDRVLPQNAVGSGNFKYSDSSRGDSIYFTTHQRDARYYGQHVYEVEPEGSVSTDPMERRSFMAPSAVVKRRTKSRGLTPEERNG